MAEENKIEIKVTRDEHRMLTAILMMHYTGMIIEVHKDKRPMLNKIAMDFSLRDIRLDVKNCKPTKNQEQ